MKNHVLRPLWVVIVLVVLILVIRPFMVPNDFGINGRNFTYGFHRLSNIQEWKNFPVKYQGREYCPECHEKNFQAIIASPHKNIQCENCHGPAVGHPDEYEDLPVDTSRELCIRCHASLEYPNSNRTLLPSIDNKRHKRKRPCSKCHNPHNPSEDI